MSKKCLIFSGGEYTPVLNENADLIIACDKGLRYAEKDGIKPDVILGDFDSYDGESEVDRLDAIRFPKEKDDTDTMLAIRYALDEGCDDILISSALGARLDHAFANIQSGAFAAERGARVSLLGNEDVIHVFPAGKISLQRKKDWALSVFSLSDRCSGVTITGTKYEIRDAELTNAFPIGVSNEWASDEAVIEHKDGILMVMESRLR